MVRTLIALILCVICTGWAWTDASGANATPKSTACTKDTKLCIGVRSLARPFSYKTYNPNEIGSDNTTGPLSEAKYSGYMTRICDAVLAEMIVRPSEPISFDGDDIGIYDLDQDPPYEKDGNLDATVRPLLSRFEDLGKKFDILCDPATLSDRRRNQFITSPPLFLTGISYLSLHGGAAPELCGDLSVPIIGLVGGTTAETEGLRALLDARELPRYRDAFIAYLNGPPNASGREKSPCKGDIVGRIKTYRTHAAAAAAFCKGQVHYYLGDLEIITANVGAIAGCEYDGGARTYSNDRYAIFGEPRPDGGPWAQMERKLLVARFFETLTQKTVFSPSILDKAYMDTFDKATPSRKLSVFYWSVRGGKL